MSPSMTRRNTSALSSPETKNHTSRLRLKVGNVKLMRSGGGFGAPVTPARETQ